jgi:hypothetical protein
VPDYCSECEQAVSRKAKFVELTPQLAVIAAMILWGLLPSIFNVNMAFLAFIEYQLPLNYQIYSSFLEFSPLVLFGLVAYLVTARVRALYRRGLRVSWGLFPFWFWLRFHWLTQPKSDGSITEQLMKHTSSVA